MGIQCTSTWKRDLSPGAALTTAMGATAQTNVRLSKGVWETTGDIDFGIGTLLCA